MIEVLRLGHRPFRDKRISTHVCLTSRAFGASKVYYSGNKDEVMEKTILRIVKEFGGDFSVEYAENAEKLIINKKREGFSIVHLTVYGKGVLEKIKEIRKEKNLLIVVGGAKVEPVFYELADFNISVTNQPHSEVASLAIILDKYFNEKEFSLDFKNAKRKIIGVEKGKKIDLMQSN